MDYWQHLSGVSFQLELSWRKLPVCVFGSKLTLLLSVAGKQNAYPLRDGVTSFASDVKLFSISDVGRCAIGESWWHTTSPTPVSFF